MYDKGAALYEVLRQIRRSVLITLTPSGAELFGRIREDELRTLAGLAADCTPEETAAALKVRTALNRDVRRRTA